MKKKTGIVVLGQKLNRFISYSITLYYKISFLWYSLRFPNFIKHRFLSFLPFISLPKLKAGMFAISYCCISVIVSHVIECVVAFMVRVEKKEVWTGYGKICGINLILTVLFSFSSFPWPYYTSFITYGLQYFEGFNWWHCCNTCGVICLWHFVSV